MSLSMVRTEGLGCCRKTQVIDRSKRTATARRTVCSGSRTASGGRQETRGSNKAPPQPCALTTTPPSPSPRLLYEIREKVDRQSEEDDRIHFENDDVTRVVESNWIRMKSNLLRIQLDSEKVRLHPNPIGFDDPGDIIIFEMNSVVFFRLTVDLLSYLIEQAR